MEDIVFAIKLALPADLDDVILKVNVRCAKSDHDVILADSPLEVFGSE